MSELNRREIFLLTAAATALPLTTMAADAPPAIQGSAGPPAIWDLTELFPSDAAWSAETPAPTGSELVTKVALAPEESCARARCGAYQSSSNSTPIDSASRVTSAT